MRETDFKQTDLGLIPSDWFIYQIHELTDITTGGTPSTEHKEFWGGTIRWMNSGELNLKEVHEVGGRITELGYKCSSTKEIPCNCVLIGLAGQGKTRGTAAYNHVSLCINQSIAAILPNESFDSRYLYYYIDSQYDNLRQLSSGDGGRGGLSKGLLLEFPILMPPSLDEQRKIAKALSDIDGLIDSLSKLIDKKKNIKTGAMQQLLTGEKRIAGYSEPWVTSKILELCLSMNSGGTPSSKTDSYYGGDIPFLSIGDMTEQGKYIESVSKYITPEGLNSSSARMVSRGTILYAMYASLGKTSIASIDLAISQAVLGIEVNPVLMNKDYLYYHLCFIENRVKLSGQTGTQSNLSKAIVQDFEVVHPKSIEEQFAIASILTDMDTEIASLEAKKEKFELVKKGMMQELLTGKVRLV